MLIHKVLTWEYLLLAWMLVKSCLLLETSFVTCWRYLDIMSSRAFWCSSRAALSSRFSCCNSRRWRFSCCIPATSTVCGRWRAVSLSSPTSSWYCQNIVLHIGLTCQTKIHAVRLHVSILKIPMENIKTCIKL